MENILLTKVNRESKEIGWGIEKRKFFFVSQIDSILPPLHFCMKLTKNLATKSLSKTS